MVFPEGTEDGACVGGPQDASGVVAAVVTVTFNRPEYLLRHLQSVLSVHGRHPDHKCVPHPPSPPAHTKYKPFGVQLSWPMSLLSSMQLACFSSPSTLHIDVDSTYSSF